jgi:hypothetical protein
MKTRFELPRLPLFTGLALAGLTLVAIASAQPVPIGESVRKPSQQRAVTEALARYRHEPSVRELITALRAREDNRRADELSDRARLSGWVPTVGLKARRGQAVDLASSSEDDALKLSTDDDLTLEAALTFDLGRVVFAREEVAIARQAHAERADTAERVREVIALYFERRRLQVERDLLAARASRGDASTPNGGEAGLSTQTGHTAPATSPPRDTGSSDAIVQRNVRIAEIEALLDAFTGGAFRRMMARPHKAP